VERTGPWGLSSAEMNAIKRIFLLCRFRLRRNGPFKGRTAFAEIVDALMGNLANDYLAAIHQ
jgi:hypothetical protein